MFALAVFKVSKFQKTLEAVIRSKIGACVIGFFLFRNNYLTIRRVVLLFIVNNILEAPNLKLKVDP